MSLLELYIYFIKVFLIVIIYSNSMKQTSVLELYMYIYTFIKVFFILR